MKDWSMGSGRAGRRTGKPSARRSPAAWLRKRLLVRLLAVLVPLLVGLGVLVGAQLGQWVPMLYLNLATAAVVGAAYAGLHLKVWWSVANLERGMDAEYRIGQVIDYALVPRNCAIAHGVIGIAAEGDIDHLVATPAGLWVVETKVRAVPRKRFRSELDRIARNVHAVEAWAPDVPVRGCLVLLEPYAGRREFEASDGMRVVVHDELSLRDALRAEADGEGMVNKKLAHRVWKLGRVSD